MEAEDALKAEAEVVLADLDILGFLRSYGDARIVGSVALDLIVKRDIDVHVHVLLHDPNGLAGDLVTILLDKDWVRNVRVDKFPDRHAVKVTVDRYPGPTGPWDIDFWITTDISTTAFEITRRLMNNLRDDQRHVILQIKDHYNRLGVLRDGLSLQIYEAVCDGGVRSVREFQDYLASLSHRS